METVSAKDHDKAGRPGQPNLFAGMDQIRQLAEGYGFSEEFFQGARWKPLPPSARKNSPPDRRGA